MFANRLILILGLLIMQIYQQSVLFILFPLLFKVCSTEFGYSRPSDNSITLRIEWLHVCQLNRTEHRAYDELIGLQHYQL
ncbi:hypothetical protein CRM22_001853, partial [Opisthorchis felineus]